MSEEESVLDDRRKRLRFRAWHRGTREMDLVLGRFVDANAAALTDGEIETLEALMEVPDPELYLWIAGTADVPAFTKRTVCTSGMGGTTRTSIHPSNSGTSHIVPSPERAVTAA